VANRNHNGQGINTWIGVKVRQWIAESDTEPIPSSNIHEDQKSFDTGGDLIKPDSAYFNKEKNLQLAQIQRRTPPESNVRTPSNRLGS